MTKLIAAPLIILLMLHETVYAASKTERYINEWRCFAVDRLKMGAEYIEQDSAGISFGKNLDCLTKDAPEGICNYVTVYGSPTAYEYDENYNIKDWYKQQNRYYIKKGWNFELRRVVKADHLEWHVSRFSKKVQGHPVEVVIYQARTPAIAPVGGAGYYPIEYTIRAIFPKKDERQWMPLVRQTFDSFRHTEPC